MAIPNKGSSDSWRKDLKTACQFKGSVSDARSMLKQIEGAAGVGLRVADNHCITFEVRIALSESGTGAELSPRAPGARHVEALTAVAPRHKGVVILKISRILEITPRILITRLAFATLTLFLGDDRESTDPSWEDDWESADGIGGDR